MRYIGQARSGSGRIRNVASHLEVDTIQTIEPNRLNSVCRAIRKGAKAGYGPSCRRQSKLFALRDFHSITSSARPSSVTGKVMPSALAALAFKAISNLVGS
jgi:hypothetical protein